MRKLCSGPRLAILPSGWRARLLIGLVIWSSILKKPRLWIRRTCDTRIRTFSTKHLKLPSKEKKNILFHIFMESFGWKNEMKREEKKYIYIYTFGVLSIFWITGSSSFVHRPGPVSLAPTTTCQEMRKAMWVNRFRAVVLFQRKREHCAPPRVRRWYLP